MKKLYKRLCIISIVIIILTIWVIGRYNHIVNDNNIIGIEGEEVYFKTPPLGIRIKKGKPDKKGINTEAGNKYYLYENQNIFGCKGDIIQNVDVNKGIMPQVNLILEEDANVLIKKGDNGNITQNVILNENITAPIKQGDILGRIEYKAGDNIILEKNLIAENDVNKSTMWNITTNLYLKWFNMCR